MRIRLGYRSTEKMHRIVNLHGARSILMIKPENENIGTALRSEKQERSEGRQPPLLIRKELPYRRRQNIGSKSN